jgi:sulfur carrier protein ThiS
MANPFTGGAAGFSGIDFLAPEVAQQQREIQRQQTIADLLRQQSLENNNQTQVVGGWAIPNSSASRFSQLGQALMAGYMQRKIDGKQAAVAQQLAERLGGVSYSPASQSGSATDTLTQAGTATSAPIYDGSVTAPSYDSRKTVAPGAAGIASEGPDMLQAMRLDAFMPGAGKAYMENWYKNHQPTDWEKEAKALFPGDPTQQAEYMKMRGNKEVSVVQQPGTTVVDMNGTTQVPMSEYQSQALENDQTRLKLQDRSTAATELSANTAARNAGGNGGFAGTNMDAQAMNAYSALSLKAQSQKLTPQEQLQLDLATRHLTQPRIGGTADTGFFEIPAQPLPTLGASSSVNAPAVVSPSASTAPVAPSATPPATPQAGAMPRVLTTPNRQPTQDQSKAAGFTSRMENAEPIFTEFSDGTSTLQTQIISGVPLVGDPLKRAAQTDSQQKYQQAQEDWVRAKLRKESGAVIGPEEMRDEIRTYFPQPGDKPGVVQQKARARAIAAEAMKKEAGPAYYKSSVSGDDKNVVKWSDLK